MDFYVFCKMILSIDIMRIGEQLAHHSLLALDSGYYADLRRYLAKHERKHDRNTSQLRLAYLKRMVYVFCKMIIMSIDIMRIGEQLAHHSL